MTTLAVDLPPTVDTKVRDWPAWRRIAFRFASAYWIAFLLTYLPGFFDEIDSSWMSKAARAVLTRVVPWVGLHVFGISVPTAQSGSGDKLFDWVQAFCVLVTGTAGGTLWCIVDRKRRHYDFA